MSPRPSTPSSPGAQADGVSTSRATPSSSGREGSTRWRWGTRLDPHVPLRSSFRPTYNMAVNLVAQVGREVAREILETSFAQFQADRAVVGIASAGAAQRGGDAGYAEAMHCHLGDFREYADLRRRLADAEKAGVRERSASRRAEAAVSMEALRIGDVIRIPAGRRAGWWSWSSRPARPGAHPPDPAS